MKLEGRDRVEVVVQINAVEDIRVFANEKCLTISSEDSEVIIPVSHVHKIMQALETVVQHVDDAENYKSKKVW